MQLTNNKLIDRGVKMIMSELKVNQVRAEKLLKKFGSVRRAISNVK
jgi:N-acetylmuramic acid 6-phosphate etherase